MALTGYKSQFNLKIILLTFVCAVASVKMLVEARAINKTAQALENKIKRDKLLARWQLQHETDLKLDEDKLKPADHLDAVKMEQDGQLNAEYQREIFLGNHEHMGSEAEVVLRDIFLKADVDKDRFLSLEEIEEWISLKIEDHLDEAEGENSRIFSLLDSDHDGFISWTEYLKQFLLVHGYNSEKAEKHINGQQKIDLDETDKAELSRYESRWKEADHSPSDERLSENEFLTFRHPEHSDAMLDTMANNIMNVLDLDKGGNLSLQEFISLPAAEVVEEKDRQMDKEWQIERANEFNDVIDMDKDGVVSLTELKNYVDPRHPSHSKMEAVNLLKMADTNKDGRLSMDEVMSNKNLLMGSKMVDTGRSFHDEF